MDLDIEDVVAGAVGSVFGKFILILVAVWIGCTVAVLCIVERMKREDAGWGSGTTLVEVRGFHYGFHG